MERNPSMSNPADMAYNNQYNPQNQYNIMNMMMMNYNNFYNYGQNSQMNMGNQQMNQNMMNPNAMNNQMMQMMGSMANMGFNPMMAMMPPFPNNYYNNQKNMFVRKAKNSGGQGNEPGSAKRKDNYRNKNHQGNKQNYAFPRDSNNYQQENKGRPPADSFNLESPYRKTSKTINYNPNNVGAANKKESVDSFRPRIDSDNFPA